MSNKDNKNEDRAAKLRKTTRSLQKKAAQLDAALSYNEQEENNRLLALRIEERKAARQDMAVADVIKDGTPEEKAILRLKDYDLTRVGRKGFLSKEEIRELHFSYETPEEKAVFLNYLKLFTDLNKYREILIGIVKMYEVEVALLSKLIDKYETIQRDIVMYELLYDSLVMARSKGSKTGMSYSLTSKDPKDRKRLDDTTPEELIADFNEIHKDDGVVFKVNIKGELHRGEIYDHNEVKIYGSLNEDGSGTLIADIDFKGGLYDQIREQAKDCKTKLSYVKAYIEPIEEYIEKNYYNDFAPSEIGQLINGIKEQEFSRRVIAKEYHLSYINDKRSKGEEVTKGEEYEAVVPDYREIVQDKEVEDSCYAYLRKIRNERPQI